MQTPHFQHYPRVLNRAVWSLRQAAQILLHLLVAASDKVMAGSAETLKFYWTVYLS